MILKTWTVNPSAKNGLPLQNAPPGSYQPSYRPRRNDGSEHRCTSKLLPRLHRHHEVPDRRQLHLRLHQQHRPEPLPPRRRQVPRPANGHRGLHDPRRLLPGQPGNMRHQLRPGHCTASWRRRYRLTSSRNRQLPSYNVHRPRGRQPEHG